jgi:hypothetical protein
MTRGELLAYAWGYDQARQAHQLIDQDGDRDAWISDQEDPAWDQFADQLAPEVVAYWVNQALQDYAKTLHL